MKTHIDYILEYYPKLLESKVLDVGSGRGRFILDMTLRGGHAVGLEMNSEYIALAKKNADSHGAPINTVQGIGEKMPFPDNSFDFANVSEVIEHVKNPNLLISEIHRVLKPCGMAYISVPNRFCLKDPHFHLYFVNWVPRSLAGTFIGIFGKHKDYKILNTGVQDLTLMNYYTFRSIRNLLEESGFMVEDIREKKIRDIFKNPIVALSLITIYKSLRFFYFDTAHIVVSKPKPINIILNADDYGRTEGITNSILEAVDKGALNGVSIIVNGDDFDRAAAEAAKRPQLRVSIHLNLTDGKPLAHNVGELTGLDGLFNNTFIFLWLKYLMLPRNRRYILFREAKEEIKAQIERFRETFPNNKIFIDGHEHIHMIPFVFDTVLELVDEFKIKYIRVPDEPLFFDMSRMTNYISLNMVKYIVLKLLSRRSRRVIKEKNLSLVSTPDAFLGVLFSGKMTGGNVVCGFKKILKQKKIPKNVEVLFHPGIAKKNEESLFYTRDRFKKWYFSPERKKEAEGLISQRLTHFLSKVRS